MLSEALPRITLEEKASVILEKFRLNYEQALNLCIHNTDIHWHKITPYAL
jgi:hypothetical protein